jgi:DNA-binding transcriptional regulator YiaG
LRQWAIRANVRAYNIRAGNEMTTREYLAAMKLRLSMSDYALAAYMGVTRQSVSKWNVGKGTMGDDLAVLIGETLDIDPAKVLADLNAERERDDRTKALWQRMASAFASVAAIGILSTIATEPQVSIDPNINSRRKRGKYATCHA